VPKKATAAGKGFMTCGYGDYMGLRNFSDTFQFRLKLERNLIKVYRRGKILRKKIAKCKTYFTVSTLFSILGCEIFMLFHLVIREWMDSFNQVFGDFFHKE
jgi:hypothetical protein